MPQVVFTLLLGENKSTVLAVKNTTGSLEIHTWWKLLNLNHCLDYSRAKLERLLFASFFSKIVVLSCIALSRLSSYLKLAKKIAIYYELFRRSNIYFMIWILCSNSCMFIRCLFKSIWIDSALGQPERQAAVDIACASYRGGYSCSAAKKVFSLLKLSLYMLVPLITC